MRRKPADGAGIWNLGGRTTTTNAEVRCELTSAESSLTRCIITHDSPATALNITRGPAHPVTNKHLRGEQLLEITASIWQKNNCEPMRLNHTAWN